MKQFQTITVGELLEELEGKDLDMPVAVTVDYGDYSHTMQVIGLGYAEPAVICESAYSRSGFKVARMNDDGEFINEYGETADEAEKPMPEVLLLNFDELD